MKTLDVRTRAAWRAWLATHHATASEVWLIFHKIHTSTRSVAYEAAVEEAVCFGWVDSLIKRIDGDRYARKFTPRKANSWWSASNRRRYAKMKAAGLLTAAGLARRPTRRTAAPPLPTFATVPSYIATALQRHAKAWTAFQALPPSHRRRYLLWIDTAKQEETRQRRLAEVMRRLARGRELGLR